LQKQNERYLACALTLSMCKQYREEGMLGRGMVCSRAGGVQMKAGVCSIVRFAAGCCNAPPLDDAVMMIGGGGGGGGGGGWYHAATTQRGEVCFPPRTQLEPYDGSLLNKL
jgi:hypothetical protein